MKLIKWIPVIQDVYRLSKECNFYMHDECKTPKFFPECICPCHGETKVEEIEIEEKK